MFKLCSLSDKLPHNYVLYLQSHKNYDCCVYSHNLRFSHNNKINRKTEWILFKAAIRLKTDLKILLFNEE